MRKRVDRHAPWRNDAATWASGRGRNRSFDWYEDRIVGRVTDTSAEARSSEVEARFDRIRARTGVVLAPLVLVGLLITPMPGLSTPAHRLAAIAAMTVVLWISEAIPLAVAALLAPALAVLLGVAPAAQVFAPFAHPLIFMFIGGFMLAEALAVHGVDRRAALWLLTRNFVRGSPTRALVVVAWTTFGFSMWINNTATAAMMCPVAIGLCEGIRKLCPADPAAQAKHRRFEEGMILTLVYSASIGGVCTPIGTAPNMIAIAELDRVTGLHFDFLRWMVFALPIGIAAQVGMLVLAVRRWPPAIKQAPGLTESVRRDLAALGPVRPGEYRAMLVFGLAIIGWLSPSVLRLGFGEDAAVTGWAERSLSESIVALLAASLLFIIRAPQAEPRPPTPSGTIPHAVHEHENKRSSQPLLNWQRATQIDWGTVFLLGSGLALGDLAVDTGLADAIGDTLENLLGAGASPLLVLFAITTVTIYMTELVSNMATINMLLPVVIPLATRTGDPVPVVITAAIAASFAFMLPVSTPPNAIVYGSGRVRLPTMMRFGARLNLVSLALLMAAGLWLLPAIRFW
jgi:sodium-dependent dicarboxylate transporter 2/3/5